MIGTVLVLIACLLGAWLAFRLGQHDERTRVDLEARKRKEAIRREVDALDGTIASLPDDDLDDIVFRAPRSRTGDQ